MVFAATHSHNGNRRNAQLPHRLTRHPSQPHTARALQRVRLKVWLSFLGNEDDHRTDATHNQKLNLLGGCSALHNSTCQNPDLNTQDSEFKMYKGFKA
jgi:hypothetical protein